MPGRKMGNWKISFLLNVSGAIWPHKNFWLQPSHGASNVLGGGGFGVVGLRVYYRRHPCQRGLETALWMPFWGQIL